MNKLLPFRKNTPGYLLLRLFSSKETDYSQESLFYHKMKKGQEIQGKHHFGDKVPTDEDENPKEIIGDLDRMDDDGNAQDPSESK